MRAVLPRGLASKPPAGGEAGGGGGPQLIEQLGEGEIPISVWCASYVQTCVCAGVSETVKCADRDRCSEIAALKRKAAEERQRRC